jgi:hypothetical protein
MKQSIKLGLLASALMAITGAVSAQVKDIVVVDTKESPYVIDARGVIVRDTFGLCWRTARGAPTRSQDGHQGREVSQLDGDLRVRGRALWKTLPPASRRRRPRRHRHRHRHRRRRRRPRRAKR